MAAATRKMKLRGEGRECLAVLKGLVAHITRQGIHGNPYADPHVNRALKYVARVEGKREYLDAVDDVPHTEG